MSHWESAATNWRKEVKKHVIPCLKCKEHLLKAHDQIVRNEAQS